ncbi:MAG: tyrosine-type recombinase/integrase [Candidatus Brocadiales bacterium]|nr:tyrosine-type recombinase/integrase [Candidatus Brocadiales bacterium]
MHETEDNFLEIEKRNQLELFNYDDENLPSLQEKYRSEYAHLLYEFFENLGRNTKRSYQKGLKDFFDFTGQHFNLPRIQGPEIFFQDIQGIHVTSYRKQLEGLSVAPKTICNRLSAITSFYTFLMEKDFSINNEKIISNPTAHVRFPKSRVEKQTQRLTKDEVRELFQITENPMHKALLMLLFTTGLRRSEVISIKMKHIHKSEGINYIDVLAKGNKEHQVALHPTTYHYIEQYLEWRKEEYQDDNSPDKWLFRPCNWRDKDKKLTPDGLRYIVERYTKKVAPSKNISPHGGRKTFISVALENGSDIYDIKESVGHSSIKTTEEYIEVSDQLKKSPSLKMDVF